MKYVSFLLIALFLYSCQNEIKKEQSVLAESSKPQKKEVKKIAIQFQKPEKGKVIKYGEDVSVSLELPDTTLFIDSVQYFVNGTNVKPKQKMLSSKTFKAGKNTIKATAFINGQAINTETYVIVVSKNPPKKLKVKKLKSYPHDVTAYTQGLIFTDGFLYEGTGQPKESMLKKINLEKNELIQSYNLPGDVFGEGIVLHNDKIYQLTWQSRRAFVYDIKTFEMIHEFEYYTEGWGITNYYDNLIMSDGTQNLYVLDPESFSVIDQLQVTSNVGPINNLNELEWIKGEIWANVYLTNTIVVIDPKTGFVERELDLSDLVPDTYANPYDNVLNGIAYDANKDKIYVTGKRWPVLYEIATDR